MCVAVWFFGHYFRRHRLWWLAHSQWTGVSCVQMHRNTHTNIEHDRTRAEEWEMWRNRCQISLLLFLFDETLMCRHTLSPFVLHTLSAVCVCVYVCCYSRALCIIVDLDLDLDRACMYYDVRARCSNLTSKLDDLGDFFFFFFLLFVCLFHSTTLQFAFDCHHYIYTRFDKPRIDSWNWNWHHHSSPSTERERDAFNSHETSYSTRGV